ncbi:maleylpyruvate isomerase family mycothiol-dependent enzyme [Streptomyces albofaciens JCM 4342]|uniref:maleylpyruvate isomerase family mycothiol-dependent enzyme n=1 Tax=Streptomyces albofaciens TaxID=66866 RepID=UPI00123B566A|nr:maleylpyruvate isomerase family mycothiol-dependent enzyme [Streptomyces albofaciens]KAA6223140.1 maleylpyruvate isomerase family mycothiol-dependent enzyme [Streptomyces albofaciens JCM 4342]
METTDLIDALAHDGQLLADAAEKAGADAPVPTCPEWRVRDLLVHTGRVHRWATNFVANAVQERVTPPEAPQPSDEALADWLRDGCRTLVSTLRAAPADLSCWTFLPAPSPLAFWARRQAHETAVHRADAESALGAGITPSAPAFAVDGIDELLMGMVARRHEALRTDAPRTLRIRATGEATGDWTIRLSDTQPHVERTADAPAPDTTAPDCVIEGPAPDLYLALWNRRPLEDLTITGDTALARLWRERFTI